MSSGGHDILIIGVGNVLRGDDGAGVKAAELIQEMHLPGVHVCIVHQLHVETLEVMSDYRLTIVIDAALGQECVDLQTIRDSASGVPSSSHHLAPQKLIALAKLVYGRELALKVCSIPAFDLGLKQQISPQTEEQIPLAVAVVLKEISRWT